MCVGIATAIITYHGYLVLHQQYQIKRSVQDPPNLDRDCHMCVCPGQLIGYPGFPSGLSLPFFLALFQMARKMGTH